MKTLIRKNNSIELNLEDKSIKYQRENPIKVRDENALSWQEVINFQQIYEQFRGDISALENNVNKIQKQKLEEQADQ